jgi:hypothetical protein
MKARSVADATIEIRSAPVYIASLRVVGVPERGRVYEAGAPQLNNVDVLVN